LSKRKFDFKFWIYRFKWNFFPKLRIVSTAPLHVDVETTDACNLRCRMCIHGLGGVKDTGFIDPELAYKVIDECGRLGVYSIKFNFRGEPLLHESLVDFVSHAKKRRIMEVQFNTNGLITNEMRSASLVNAGLDRIIFSVDGATKETYENIRIGGSYDKLISNIDAFLEIKRRKGLTKPAIRVQMVKYYGAEKEEKEFVKLWNEKGVDNIAVIEKQDRDVKNGYPLKNGKRPIGRAFCEQPWQRLNVNRDGKVLMCCGDWERKSVVGDLRRQTLEEIWKSEIMREMREKIRSGRLDEIPACRTCFRPTTYRWE